VCLYLCWRSNPDPSSIPSRVWGHQ
jgi:hypothetical protein